MSGLRHGPINKICGEEWGGGILRRGAQGIGDGEAVGLYSSTVGQSEPSGRRLVNIAFDLPLND